MTLNNKVALVTGGAKRIGNAIVHTLAARGCKVIVHYHTSRTEAEETVRTLHTSGAEAIALQADITQEAQVEQLVREAIAHFGRIDILVNNASLFYRTPVATLTQDEIEKIIDTNLTGTFICCVKVGKHMYDQGSGHIINMADVAGIRPWVDYIPYSVAKGCILTLTQGVAMELAPHILVNAVIPGPMLFQDDTPEEVRQREIEKTLVKRMGTPQEVADLVAFVAESDYSTGSVFHIDGGRSLT